MHREVDLSDVQLQILLLSSKGLKCYAIACKLGISENTIKYHKKRIFSILNVSTTAEAITKAYAMKLIEILPKSVVDIK